MARLRHGFTLIELLVVVAIVAMLIAILLPSLNEAREAARRVACAMNTRQITTAAITHAADHSRGAFLPTYNDGEDDLNHLYPAYLPDPNIARCPSTANAIRRDVFMNAATAESRYGHPGLVDLLKHIAGAARIPGTSGHSGHSYEAWAWFNGPIMYPDGTVIDGRTIGNVATQRGGGAVTTTTSQVLKTVNNTRFPSRALFTLDGDDSGLGNWPDESNNHGPAGLNISFLDGHTSWYTSSPDLARVYLESYHSPLSDSLWVSNGVTIGSTSSNGSTIRKYSF